MWQQHLGIITVGIVVGFLGGLFGKGGSAVATPLLSLIGLPGYIAVASPLPATIPGTLIASNEYWRYNLSTGKLLAGASAWACPRFGRGISLLTNYTLCAPAADSYRIDGLRLRPFVSASAAIRVTQS